jgi:hypothetical protein
MLISLGLLGIVTYGLGQMLRHKTNNRGTDIMNDAQTKTVELLSLQDEEYFAFDEQSQSALSSKLTDILREDPFAAPPSVEPSTERPPLVVIGAPRIVKLDQRDDLPVLIAVRTTGLRDWQVEKEQNARIVLVDLESGVIKTQRLFGTHKRMRTPEPSMSGPRPDELNAATVGTSLNRHIGLRRQLGIKWRPGRYAVNVIIYDWVSNTVVVELQGEESRQQQLQPRASSEFLSSTIANDETPILKQLGAALSVPAKVGRSNPIELHGAVRMPFAPAAVVPRRVESPPTNTSMESPLLLASVMLIKLDAEDPVQIDLAIPATVSGEFGQEQTIQAFFSLDVRTALPGYTLSGKYQTYLVVGDRVAGPYLMTVGAF